MPALEGGAALLGLVLTLGAIGVLLHEGVSGASVPPDIVVSVEGIRAGDGGGHLVEFVARNHGDQTAAQVTIQGELQSTGGGETSEVTIDYIPDGSERRGGLFFAEDPRGRQLDLRALGYTQP
ncbi:MAG TPA: hypothetical protein VK943_20730 [Arenibaculum sp.]|nr:hypothetical protein [Arenibaculum sp.]